MILWLAYFISTGSCGCSCVYLENQDSIDQKHLLTQVPTDTTRIRFRNCLITPDAQYMPTRDMHVLFKSTIQDSQFVFIRDCSSRTFQVFHVPTFRFLKPIAFPKSIMQCASMYSVCSSDLKSFAYIDDQDQGVCFSYSHPRETPFNIIEILRSSKYHLDYNLLDHNQIYMDTESRIFIPIAFEGSVKGFRKSKALKSAIRYSVTTNQIDFLGDRNVAHDVNGYFGLHHRLNQYFSDSTIVYSYPYKAEIVKYDLRTNDAVSISAKSRYHIFDVPPMPKKYNRDDLWQHAKENGFYEHLVFHPEKEIYFRFYLLPIPARLPDGKYSTMNDRRISVMVMDKDFTVLSEKILPESCHFIGLVVPTAEGVWVNAGSLIPDENHQLNALEILY